MEAPPQPKTTFEPGQRSEPGEELAAAGGRCSALVIDLPAKQMSFVEQLTSFVE
jgi:hypothetical protein